MACKWALMSVVSCVISLDTADREMIMAALCGAEWTLDNNCSSVLTSPPSSYPGYWTRRHVHLVRRSGWGQGSELWRNFATEIVRFLQIVYCIDPHQGLRHCHPCPPAAGPCGDPCCAAAVQPGTPLTQSAVASRHSQ